MAETNQPENPSLVSSKTMEPQSHDVSHLSYVPAVNVRAVEESPKSSARSTPVTLNFVVPKEDGATETVSVVPRD